jgi:hypothetical protein
LWISGIQRQVMSGHSITIVTAMRNEGPFVLEWIAHHRALGVTDFVVVTNDCDDGTDRLLDRLAAAGEVVHLRQEARPGRVQWGALALAEKTEEVRGADWVLGIDVDEFMNLRPPLATLADLVTAAGEADAVVLPWRFFGHGGHLRFSEDPVSERFTRAIPEDALFPGFARSFKTLARWKGGAFRRLGIHRPRGDTRNAMWLDGSGRRQPDDFAHAAGRIVLMTPRIESGLVQLNHYSVRSAEDFLVKRARGLPNRAGKRIDALYWAERNFNNVEDGSIARHRAGTAREASRLLSLPGVLEAHAAAVAAHRTKIAAILATPEGATLFSRLALLPTSVPPPPEEALRLLALMRHAGRAD